MTESLELSTVLPASPEQVYRAWMDSKEHARFTGSAAQIDPQIGGAFTAWDGYIEGKTLELEPCCRIVQAWRTSDFPPGAPDSRLEVLIAPVEHGSKVTILHTGIPDGQAGDYRQGWEDYYFSPMQEYFGS